MIASANAVPSRPHGICDAFGWRPIVVALFMTTVVGASSVSAAPWTLAQTFDNPTGTAFDLFGFSVGIDGNKVLIGEVQNAGQAGLFDAISGNLLHTFDDPTITTNDQFGGSVAIAGKHVLIGASLDDTNGLNVGQAHLFDAVSGNLVQTFDDPTVTTQDQFGFSAALNGQDVLVGAYLDDSGGRAHLFRPVIPLPTSAWMGMCLFGGLGAVGVARRLTRAT